MSMWTRLLFLAVAIMTTEVSVMAICPTCIRCSDDACVTRGCDASGGTSGCQPARPESQSFLDVRHPGFFAAQQSGRLTIMSVVENSPAELAGLRAGDEVVSINGRSIIRPCYELANGWDEFGQTASVRIRRGGSIQDISVGLVPVRKMLAGLWMRSALVLPARLSTHGNSERFPRGGLYSFGIEIVHDRKNLIVTGVLRGSPAERHGISPGDRILAVNGAPVAVAPARSASSLLPSSRKSMAELTLQRGDGTETLILAAQGLNRILAGAGTHTPAKRVNVARLD